MKAYNEQWIYNRSILEQAERWYQQQLLSREQIVAFRKAYPVDFRQTNSFLEIGLFLFTTVALLACYLLPASLFYTFSESAFVNIGFGIVVGLVGRSMINRRLLYRNGVDNAFVVTMTGFLAFGFNQLLPDSLSTSIRCFLTLPLLLLVLWYYGDTLIAFFCIATLYTGIFDGLLNFSWGKIALPFVMMAVSLLLFLLTARIQTGNPRQVYYTDPLNLVQWISLTVLATSGNYFVVRELNGLLLHTTPGGPALTEAPEIGLPVLFWLLTFLIPALYVWQGLTRKNRMLIILGALGLIAAVATVHEYHALVPLNVFLTLGGLALAGIAVFFIRYLAKPKHSFTDAPDADSPNEFWMNAATVAAIQATGTAQHSHKDDLRFGGGNFGGGGSEGTY